MRSAFSLTSKSVRHFCIIALALWVAGVGCLVSCGAHDVQAVPTTRQTDEAVSCSHHACCQMERESDDTSAGVSSTEQPAPIPTGASMSCCPLAGLPTTEASKRRVTDENAAALTIHRASVMPRADARSLSPAERFYLPDRGGTYLRCCVFLI